MEPLIVLRLLVLYAFHGCELSSYVSTAVTHPHRSIAHTYLIDENVVGRFSVLI